MTQGGRRCEGSSSGENLGQLGCQTLVGSRCSATRTPLKFSSPITVLILPQTIVCIPCSLWRQHRRSASVYELSCGLAHAQDIQVYGMGCLHPEGHLATQNINIQDKKGYRRRDRDNPLSGHLGRPMGIILLEVYVSSLGNGISQESIKDGSVDYSVDSILASGWYSSTCSIVRWFRFPTGHWRYWLMVPWWWSQLPS